MLSREVFEARAARLAETLDELRNGTGPAVEHLLLQAWDDGFQAQSAENAALGQHVEELKKERDELARFKESALKEPL